MTGDRIGKDITVALFASWLYDHLKKYRAARAEVDGREVGQTETEIETAIELRLVRRTRSKKSSGKKRKPNQVPQRNASTKSGRKAKPAVRRG